jgi:hypothetical protein
MGYCTTDVSPNVITNHAITHNNKTDLWHRKLGHIKQKRLHQIQLMSISIEKFDEKKKLL